MFLRASSDEQDALQIEAGDFLDACDSKIGIGSGGEDRQSAGNEHLINKRNSLGQFESMAKKFAGTKSYRHLDKQTCLKFSCMQQKVCDVILFSKSSLKEHAFKDDDLRLLPVVPEHFKYFKTPKCNDSLCLTWSRCAKKSPQPKLMTKCSGLLNLIVTV